MRRFSCSLSPAASGSKSHSAAIWERKPEASKNVIRRVAVRPAVIASQKESRVLPPGATTPTPVTAVLLGVPPSLISPLLRVHVPGVGAWRQRPEVEDY